MTIEVSDLTVWSQPGGRQERARLHELTCQIPHGGVTLLIGQTGAGKSTLLWTLSGLLRPTTGQILYDTSALWPNPRPTSRPDPKLLRGFGVGFQGADEHWVRLSVAAEFRDVLRPLRLGKQGWKSRMQTALAAWDLAPQLATQSPWSLSGGQLRRAALAALWATEPQWLFLDEPSAGLDGSSLARLEDLIRSRKQSHPHGGTVIVTHDLDRFFPLADHVILLHQGRLCAQGQPSDLLITPEVFTRADIQGPSWLAMQQRLAEHGLILPATSSATAMAHHIFAVRTQRADTRRHEATSEQGVSTATRPVLLPDPSICTQTASTVQPVASKTADSAEQTHGQKGWLWGRDPLATWLSTAILALACLTQQHLLGLGVAWLAAIATVWGLGLGWNATWSLLKPVFIFFGLSAILAGLQWHPQAVGLAVFGFSPVAAMTTGIHLLAVLASLLVAGAYSILVSPLQLEHTVVRVLAVLDRVGFPVKAIAMGIATTFRFLPIAGIELTRFSRMLQARRRIYGRPGRIRASDLPATLLPLLLRLFRFGEEFSTALELRGYTLTGSAAPTTEKTQPWRGPDWAIVGWGVLWSMVLFVMAW